jgi:hypothetical protein
MKKWGCIAAMLFAFGCYAQQVNYKVLKDNPLDVSNAYLNLELLQFEMPLNNLKGGMAFCIGGSVYTNYRNKFGADLVFRRGWLNFFGVPRTTFELGGFYNLTSRTKTRNQRVVLEYDKYTSGGYEYEETKFIKCPATNLRSLGVRAGFLTNKEGYEDSRVELSPMYKYSWSGIYAGILLTSQMNYRINTDTHGEAGAGFVRRYYLDASFHPFASLTDLETGNKNTTTKIGRLGVRAGLEAMPAERRKMKQAPVYIRVEVGMRPLDGLYMMGSFGVNFKRKFQKLGTVEAAPREKE